MVAKPYVVVIVIIEGYLLAKIYMVAKLKTYQ